MVNVPATDIGSAVVTNAAEIANTVAVAIAAMPPVTEEPVMQSVTIGYIVSALLIGGAFGWVLQRGRFCMNTAFREVHVLSEDKDYTPFRIYVLALVIMIIGANALNEFGIIHLMPQTFYPVANIAGGFLFGLGIVIAGGCGSGIIFRIGEGQLNAVLAVLGFFMGIGATSKGILKPLYEASRSYQLGPNNWALWQLAGDSMMIKWAFIAVICIGGLIFVMAGKPFSPGKQKGYYWSLTGVLAGVLGVLAFWASEYYGGFARGLNFTTPTREFFWILLTGSAATPSYFPMQKLGSLEITWPSVYIVAVPIGAYISAKLLKEFKWKVPPANELLKVFGGSLLMGVGATMAGGCNVGQALTGFSTLSIASIVATIAIILGNWVMVYYVLIKPMRDL